MMFVNHAGTAGTLFRAFGMSGEKDCEWIKRQISENAENDQDPEHYPEQYKIPIPEQNSPPPGSDGNERSENIAEQNDYERDEGVEIQRGQNVAVEKCVKAAGQAAAGARITCC